MARAALLVLLVALLGVASAQNKFILAFFTNADCNYGNALVPAPTSFSVGACTPLPGAPANFPGGQAFNTTGVGASFTFNTNCDSTCTVCQGLDLDLTVCTQLPFSNNIWVQYFEVIDAPLYIATYLDPSCNTRSALPRAKVSSGQCTDTGNALTDNSFFAQTKTNELVIGTNCGNSQCTNCNGLYKENLGKCFTIVESTLFARVGSSAVSVAASFAAIIAALVMLAL